MIGVDNIDPNTPPPTFMNGTIEYATVPHHNHVLLQLYTREMTISRAIADIDGATNTTNNIVTISSSYCSIPKRQPSLFVDVSSSTNIGLQYYSIHTHRIAFVLPPFITNTCTKLHNINDIIYKPETIPSDQYGISSSATNTAVTLMNESNIIYKLHRHSILNDIK